MALTKEQLIQSGIEEEIAEKVLNPINNLFKSTLDNNYVSKESFNSVNTKKNELQTQLDIANTEITRLKPLEEKISALNTTITQLEHDKSELQTKYNNQATVLQQENIVKSALMNVVVDMDDVFPKLDMQKIIFKDNKIESGLQEQLDTLKQSKPHYFKSVENKNNFFGFSPNNSNNNNNNNDSVGVSFAKELAKSVITQSEAMKKANDTYFKGGIN